MVMRYDAQFLWIKFDFLELFVPIQKQEWTGGGLVELSAHVTECVFPLFKTYICRILSFALVSAQNPALIKIPQKVI